MFSKNEKKIVIKLPWNFVSEKFIALELLFGSIEVLEKQNIFR